MRGRYFGKIMFNARRTGVRKDVNPHNFRHSRATDLANWMTEAQMDKFFGWVLGSKIVSIYIHLSGKDIDEAILRIYGKVKESSYEQLKTKICPICGYENPPETEFCLRCRRSFSFKAALEIEEGEKELLRMITPEMIEQMIQRKVEERLSMYLPRDKVVEAEKIGVV